MRTAQRVVLNLIVTTKDGRSFPLFAAFEATADNPIVSAVLKSWDSDFIQVNGVEIVPIDSAVANGIREKFFGEEYERARRRLDEQSV